MINLFLFPVPVSKRIVTPYYTPAPPEGVYCFTSVRPSFRLSVCTSVRPSVLPSFPRPKWVSGDFIPRQLADVLVEENIAGMTESDESDDEFDDVLYSLIDGEEED